MKEDGFTLLEVVVAFAIASLALTVLYDTTGLALDRQRQATGRLHQIAVAERLMESVGTEYPLGELTRAGVTEEGINWSLVIKRETIMEEGRGPLLYVIEAAAWRNDEAGAVRFSTWRSGPTE